MKIAFVHNRYVDYRIPFFEMLSKQYNVKFFFEYEKDIKTIKIKSNFLKAFKIASKNFGFSPSLPLKLILGRFDLFISGELGYDNTLITFLVAKLLNKPFIIWSEEWYPAHITHPHKFVIKQFIARHASATIGPGIKSVSFLQQLGAQKEKTFTAPNASIPSTDFSKKMLPFVSETFPNNDKVKILFLGRIIKSKGIDYLIKAFWELEQRNSDVLLIIAGNGPYLPQLKKLAKSLKIQNLIFTENPAAHRDKFRLYQNCDLFVLPSIYEHYVEAWGLVLNEAMYFGKPVIATETVGAAYDLIKDGGNGFIVLEKDVQALNMALLKIINDNELRKSMGRMSKKIIEEGYKWSDMVKGFEKAIAFCTKAPFLLNSQEIAKKK